MARFSLSPPASSSARGGDPQEYQDERHLQTNSAASAPTKTPPQWKWNFPPQDHYYHRSPLQPSADEDEDESSDESSEWSSSSDPDADDTEAADCSSSDEEDEPPHPLGFESRYGRTRFSLSPRESARTSPSDRRPSPNISNRDDEYAWNALIHVDDKENGHGRCQQTFPPIKNYLNRGNVVCTQRLLRGVSSQRRGGGDIDEILSGMDRIANLVKVASYVQDDGSSQGSRSFPTPQAAFHQQSQPPPTYASPNSKPRSVSKLLQLATACEQQQNALHRERTRMQKQREKPYQQSCEGFLLLLEADAKRISSANERINKRAQQLKDMEEKERLEQLVYEEQLKQQRELEEKEEADRLAAEASRSEEERQREARRLEQLKQAEEEAEREALKKNEHISRAKSIIANLEEVRNSLKEFDQSKAVSRRRLQFKKVVNGKINTLSHDESKVLEVAKIVADAIAAAANDDASSSGGDPATTMGKKYLLDLLCANLIVRVQADGFNGTRGDGFPLAAMFAHVSLQCEEIGPVLEGHLYAVAPTAIPTLSLKESASDGEHDLMESLGMIKDENGEFETFDKFLQRTEGLISIMADIMSSRPIGHTLLGGSAGALKWLQRFMDLLPPSPSTLPILTAPVLIAFITGAGHMLSNKLPDEFQRLFDLIEKDILTRLDESPVGVPSATRLKKVIESGVSGLKRDLPHGAVASLYDGGKDGQTPPTGTRLDSQSRTPDQAFDFSSSSSASGQTTQASSFGSSNVASSSNPFSSSHWGGSIFANSMDESSASTQANQSSASNEPSPFGAFGSTAATGQSSGFGSFAPASTSPSPFASSGSSSSVFGSKTAAAPSPSPFGGASGFGQSTGAPASNSAFGSNEATSSSFGQSTMDATPSPSPFGMNAKAATNPSPFGSTPAAPSPSPFGKTAMNASSGQSPFGSSTGFGSSQPLGSSPFGSANQSSAPNPSPFGSSSGGGDTKKKPCEFFQKGICRYGDRCKFSHDLGGGGGGASSASPFGNTSSNTFGGGSTSSASPFGNTSGNTFGGTDKNKKQPCKFFASGNCKFGDKCRFSHELGGGSSGNAFGSGGFGNYSKNNRLW